MSDYDEGFLAAREEAKEGAAEGGQVLGILFVHI